MERLTRWRAFFEALSALMMAYRHPIYPRGRNTEATLRRRELATSDLLMEVASLSTQGGDRPPVTLEVSAQLDDGRRWAFECQDAQGEDPYPTSPAPARSRGLMRPSEVADIIFVVTEEGAGPGEVPTEARTRFTLSGGHRVRLAWIGEAKRGGPVEVLEDPQQTAEWIRLHQAPTTGE